MNLHKTSQNHVHPHSSKTFALKKHLQYSVRYIFRELSSSLLIRSSRLHHTNRQLLGGSHNCWSWTKNDVSMNESLWIRIIKRLTASYTFDYMLFSCSGISGSLVKHWISFANPPISCTFLLASSVNNLPVSSFKFQGVTRTPSLWWKKHP